MVGMGQVMEDSGVNNEFKLTSSPMVVQRNARRYDGNFLYFGGCQTPASQLFNFYEGNPINLYYPL